MPSLFSLLGMPNPARITVLRATAQILGGMEALAEALAVSALQVEQWISGKESIPAEIFLRAVDLLESHDRRKQPRPSGNDTQRGQS